jgi:hypothetical protein
VTKRIAIEMMVIASIGLALSALGPFGSYSAPFVPRAILWTGLILAGYVILRPVLAVANWLAYATGLTRFASRLLALTVGALPLSMLIEFFLSRLLGRASDFSVERYIQVWGIGLVVTLVMGIVFHRNEAMRSGSSGRPADPMEPVETRSEFFERLPAVVGSSLVCLSMEDHYVRVHGSDGNALILMRMRDAVAELKDVPGLRVHRSWWVADEAVVCMQRDGERLQLRLSNGFLVPVARSQSGAVRARGWRLG